MNEQEEPKIDRQPKWILIGAGARINGQMYVDLLDEKPEYMYPGQTLYKVIPVL